MQACKLVGLMIPLCAAMDPWPRMGVVETRASRPQPRGILLLVAGGRVFEDHCATCHRPNVTERMPRSRETAKLAKRSRGTDGKIFWLLRNGNLPKGMPTWAALPEPTRCQIIAYIKSLGPATPAAAPCAAVTKPN